MTDEKLMLSLRETARRTGLSYTWLRKQCNNGALAHVRCGTKILVNYEALLKKLENAGRSDNQEAD